MTVNSLMQLDCFFLDNLEIKTKSIDETDDVFDGEFDSGIDRKANISFFVNKKDDENKFRVHLRIKVLPKNPKEDLIEKIIIELTGFFSFPNETPEDEIDRYVPLLCLTNLFGIARGIVAQSTGLCYDGPVLLPLVNMNKVVREHYELQRKKKEEASEKKVDENESADQ